MINNPLRNSLNPSFLVSMPSIDIEPPSNSTMRNNAAASEDLPEPVLPTTPTRWPPWIDREIPFNTRGPSRYRIFASSTTMLPMDGVHSSFVNETTSAASRGTNGFSSLFLSRKQSPYSPILSMAAILDANNVDSLTAFFRNPVISIQAARASPSNPGDNREPFDATAKAATDADEIAAS